MVLPGNGLTLADTAAVPAVVLTVALCVRRLWMRPVRSQDRVRLGTGRWGARGMTESWKASHAVPVLRQVMEKGAVACTTPVTGRGRRVACHGAGAESR